MIKGSFTALITPFNNFVVDYEKLDNLLDFQIKNGITGILAVGTTGESPSLTWEEHNKIIENVAKKTKGQCICIAGTGSNNTNEALQATEHAAGVGVDAVLLVDPYYNGPSSLEIRKEYIGPVARTFPEVEIIPYVIPGRTGTQLLPDDLALLHKEFKNINTVKEATANIENIRHTRACCGNDFIILSGDDGITYDIMIDPLIKAGGVISVISNIAPKAVAEMVSLVEQGKQNDAKSLLKALEPLFKIVTVTTREVTPYGEVVFRARNPLGIKVLMAILGITSGELRKPLGKMTKNGFTKVIEAAKKVQIANPEIFQPAADFFGIDIEARLKKPSSYEGLFYKRY